MTRRPSTRWHKFDYTLPANYFITICTAGRRCTLGTVVDGRAMSSGIGEIIDEEWRASASIRPGLILDRHVIMPNHVHAIFFLPGADPETRTTAPATGKLTRPPRSLGSFVGGFKSRVTSRVRQERNDPRLTVWQEGFHDRVIRNTRELGALREYVRLNPERWASDSLHPDNL